MTKLRFALESLGRVAVVSVLAGLAVTATSGGMSSCAGNADQDADGFFGESALCGGPLFDCQDDDRSVGNGRLYFCDSDGDGYGDPKKTVYLCDEVECDVVPCDGVTNALDCDDTVFDATNELTGIQLYPDCDGDSLGDPSRSLLFCTSRNDQAPSQDFIGCPYVLNGDDCDDTDAIVNLQNQVYLDCDGDGYGDDVVGPFRVCSNAFNLPDSDPAKACLFVSRGGDCKDDDETVNEDNNAQGNVCPDAG